MPSSSLRPFSYPKLLATFLTSSHASCAIKRSFLQFTYPEISAAFLRMVATDGRNSHVLMHCLIASANVTGLISSNINAYIFVFATSIFGYINNWPVAVNVFAFGSLICFPFYRINQCVKFCNLSFCIRHCCHFI